MKNTIVTTIANLTLATVVCAGPSYSSKGKEVIPPPPTPCLWSWFAGGSIGHIDGDWDEEIYTLHIGREITCPGKSCTHAFFLEIGYTEKELSASELSIDDPNFNGFHPGPVTNIPGFESYNLDIEIIPITINYKFECQLADKLSWYVGAGIGIALVDANLTREESGDPPQNFDDNDVVFYGHAFAGLTYNFSPTFEAFLGARYIFMNDPSFSSDLEFHNVDNVATYDGEIQYELGVRFNF